MANEIKLTFAGDSKQLQKASQDAAAATKSVADEASKASKDAQSFGDRMAKTGAAAAGMSAAIDDAGQSVQALVDFQNRGRERAAQLARAESDVEQAMLDARQAVIDLRQAQEDLSQAQLDGKQAGEDAAQAALDLEQANLDAKTAQQDYNLAVKEHGAGSLEAQQAALDLKQAQRDVAQANLDAEQATRDLSQATLDGEQAQSDMAQAAKDGRDAQLDLNEAWSEAHPSDLQNAATEIATYANVVAGVVGVIDLLTLAHNALSLSAIRAAASTTAAKVATIAGTVATGIATAAQWLWNVALTANPIGIIIVAVAALVGVIIWLATQTQFFQTIWEAVWGFLKAVGAWFAGPFANFFVSAWNMITGAFQSAWNWIKNLFLGIVVWEKSWIDRFMAGFHAIPGALKTAFDKVTDFITAPFRAAFNFVARAWNATIGRLSWTVPSWVPGIGGNSLSAPRLSQFHTGGIVSGAMGSETLAVLQAGERVTAGSNSGGGAVGVLRVVGNGSDRLATFLHELARNDILRFELVDG